MSELLRINVNEHTEKKNGLSYLSWAWAWAEVLKVDPQATWEAVEFDGFPASFAPDGSALVKTLVTIKGHTKSCWLPVMNHRNQAIKNPDAFAVNTALVRCLTKCISMHGLGLYIYAGEDLPEGEEEKKEEKPVTETGFRSSATMGEYENLQPEEQAYIMELAIEIVALVASEQPTDAWRKVENENLDDSQKTALWSRLDSKTRAAIRKAGQSLKEVA